MFNTDQTENEIKLLKYRKNLITSGWAVVAFCVWDIAKVVISLLLKSTYTLDLANTYHTDDKLLFFFEVFFTVVLFAVIIYIQIYAGVSAVAVGKGKKKGVGYLVISVVLLIVTVVSIVFSAESIVVSSIGTMQGVSFDTAFAGIILDLTLGAALIDLLVSSFKVRRLSRVGEAGDK